MRFLITVWVMLLSCLAEAQQVTSVIPGTAVMTPGSQAVSGLFSGEIDLMYTVGNVDGGGSIEFGVCAVDPLNPSHASQCGTSPAVTVATGDAGVVTLSAPHSSSVVVSWAIDGGFYAPVWLSVQGIGSPVGQGGGGGGGGAQDAGVYLILGSTVIAVIDGGVPGITPFDNWATNNVFCGTSATALPLNFAPHSGWLCQNDGPNPVGISDNTGTAPTLNGPGTIWLAPAYFNGGTLWLPGDSVVLTADAYQSATCISPVAQVDGGTLQCWEVF